ncbi:MAG: hypothetical protein B7X50_09005 [Alishewanella sp. 34-51-39]|nr:MAG: hypothetical protein B7X50_09005 [Alishewanella sp. 34-51-39]
MNEFTLMIIFSAVMLMLVVAVHLWAQAKRVGIYAPEPVSELDAEVDELFDHIEDGLAECEELIKQEYEDALGRLYGLALDLRGSGYAKQYNDYMVDWVAYSEQEPSLRELRKLNLIVQRANAEFETPPTEQTPFWCTFDRMEGGAPDIARFETREELDSFMANTVHKVTEYGPRVAGLTIDNVADATFIINRHAIRCISDTWVGKDGMTWLALRDELIFSVIYEDADICHCKVVPGFEWLALDYIDEGVIPVSMVEVEVAHA